MLDIVSDWIELIDRQMDWGVVPTISNGNIAIGSKDNLEEYIVGCGNCGQGGSENWLVIDGNDERPDVFAADVFDETRGRFRCDSRTFEARAIP